MARHLKNLLQTIDRTNRVHQLIQRGDHIVVAMSGGPDSTALLLALSKLKHKYELELGAAHLNHGLQGRQSEIFMEQAKRTCAQLGVPFYSKKVSVAELSKRSGRSIEETGRIERYAFFTEIAQKTGSSKIATAHTLDDQAETVLLRILRGAGLRGLSGVPFKRAEGQKTVIRPLLLCKKRDLLKVLKESKVSFAKDPTNQETLFTRNRVRRALLPYLERSFNPSVKEALSGLQTASLNAQSFIEQKAADAFKKCATLKKTALSLHLPALKRLHPALQSEVLFQALRRVKGSLTRFTQSQIEDLRLAARSETPNLVLKFPGVDIRKEKKELRLTPSGNGAIIPTSLNKKRGKGGC